MHNVIKLEDALQLDNPIYIDMRSPVEFAGGSIPGAINIPLLTNDERAKVGTVYKNTGAEEAKHLGLSLVSSKLPDIVAQIRSLDMTGGKVIVYCWRGGMRSKSIVNILDMMGVQAFQLLGGYKSYRQYVLDRLTSFTVKPTMVVLCGLTGTGKTIVLNRLAEKGVPIIDLERLANHRGSVFGQIGLGCSSTAQNFDAALLTALEKFNDQPCIIVECESKRIGNVYLPNTLFDAMKQGKKLLLFTDVETRISRLISEYLDVYNNNQEAIIASMEALRKRLGNKKTDQLLVDFASGRIRDVVRMLLVDYYDPMYGYEKAEADQFDKSIQADDLDQATIEIIEYLQQLGR